jgi:putative transposase
MQCVSTTLMEKYQGKYRISSCRRQGFDYSSTCDYYITLCTLNRVHYFGEIKNKEMRLSEIGKYTIQQWLQTPDMRSNMKIMLGEYCLMPDHFHAIISFKEDIDNTHKKTFNKFGPQSNNLPSVIRGFKGAVTSYAIKNSIEFYWQSKYYDHIIRNESDYNRIKKYIEQNINNWDRNNNM